MYKQLTNVGAALEKLVCNVAQAETDFRAGVAVAEESLNAEKTHVKRLERDRAAKAGIVQQALAKRRETHQAGSRHLIKGEGSLHDLQSSLVAVL